MRLHLLHKLARSADDRRKLFDLVSPQNRDGATTQHLSYNLVSVIGNDGHNRYLGPHLSDGPGYFRCRHPGKLSIYHDDIGMKPVAEHDRVYTVRSFTDDREVHLLLDDQDSPSSRAEVVADDQDPQGLSARTQVIIPKRERGLGTLSKQSRPATSRAARVKPRPRQELRTVQVRVRDHLLSVSRDNP